MRNLAQINTSRSTGGNAIVAANVRAQLGYVNLKQGAIAEVLGLSQMAVSRRLSSTTEFTAGEIVLLAEFFGIQPGDLFKKKDRPFHVVGTEGLEPPTSTVEYGRFDDDHLAIVTPLRRHIA